MLSKELETGHILQINKCIGWKFKMAAFTIATMINNKVLMIISSKFHHAELIDNHYFGICGKIKKTCLRTRPLSLNIFGGGKNWYFDELPLVSVHIFLPPPPPPQIAFSISSFLQPQTDTQISKQPVSSYYLYLRSEMNS